jgi:hypothetical protein
MAKRTPQSETPNQSKPNGNGAKLIEEFQQKMDERIAARDLKKLDPTERAQFVHELIFWALDLHEDDAIITGFVLWDILCFCVHMLNQYALQLQDDEFMLMARVVNTWLFTVHYNMEETALQLGPGRVQHIEFWKSQLYEPLEEEAQEQEQEGN